MIFFAYKSLDKLSISIFRDICVLLKLILYVNDEPTVGMNSFTKCNFVSLLIIAVSVSSIDFVNAENLNSLLNYSNLLPEKLLIVFITAVLIEFDVLVVNRES